jgi:mitogen-activated protein kinase kinase kinase 1
MGAIDRSSTASPASLIGRGSLTRSDGLDRRHSEPILDLPPSPEALLSPGDGTGKVAQFDFNNQGGIPGKKESFLGDVDDLPTAPVVPSSSRSRIFSKDSHRTKSVGSSLRWKSSKDSLEVDPCANLPEEISVGSRAADSEDSEIPEKEKLEEVSTPSSGDSSTDMLPGVFPKNPNWSTWAKGEFLGRGTFGTVYEGVGSNGMFFAVKEVSLVEEGKAGKQAIRQLEQEIALLSEIQHPNIVQYLGTERDDEKLYIFLELVSKGSLAHLYEKYEFFYDQVRLYTKQILLGLKYLHDRKIIHRDIKCANILVDASGTVKLADFGMAKQTDKLGMLKSFLGSAHWMAPEVVRGGAAGRSYNLKADIWSLGCTVLEMATGNPPYGEMESHVVLFRVGSGEAPTIPEELDEDLKDFIRNCLEVNVANRPTCDLLLTHPFITGEPMTGPVKLVPTPELMPSIAEERSIDISVPSSATSSLDGGASSSSLVTNMMNHGSIVRGQPKSMRKIRSEFSMSSAESITS